MIAFSKKMQQGLDMVSAANVLTCSKNFETFTAKEKRRMENECNEGENAHM